MGLRLALVLVALGLATACSGGANSPDPDPDATGSRAVEPRWFAVSGDDFIDTRSGDTFVPRGVNLLRKDGGGADLLFNNYNAEWVEAQLDSMVGHGFNTVRFFLDMCMSCTTSAEGLRPDYLDELTDLLTRIEAHGLAAFPTSNDVPDPGFSDRLPCCSPFGGYRNSLYLSAAGHEIAVEYWTALLEGIAERGAPTHHVLGWELANEQFVLRDVAPISLTSGSVTTADGRSYDLSDDAAVEAMVVSNLRSYITGVGEAVRAVDEGALVSMGFFAAEEPRAGRVAHDNRWVVPDDIVRDSTLDFVDLHAYPGLGGTWDLIGPAYGLTGEPAGFPLLLGEYGAFEEAFPDPAEAAAAMARFQAESCDWGFGGWLLWFWGADLDDEVITADAHDGVVATAASPTKRPDPCAVGSYESPNLALGRPVKASAEENREYGARRVNDGSEATWWSAAAGPPQWVEIDLESRRPVTRVRILIGDVSTPGPQTHRVLVRRMPGGPLEPVGRVSANARHGDWLTVELAPRVMASAVRVETAAADGWVILHEIVIDG